VLSGPDVVDQPKMVSGKINSPPETKIVHLLGVGPIWVVAEGIDQIDQIAAGVFRQFS
jgi:hypothetical protein